MLDSAALSNLFHPIKEPSNTHPGKYNLKGVSGIKAIVRSQMYFRETDKMTHQHSPTHVKTHRSANELLKSC